jgi:hypothetical protein
MYEDYFELVLDLLSILLTYCGVVPTILAISVGLVIPELRNLNISSFVLVFLPSIEFWDSATDHSSAHIKMQSIQKGWRVSSWASSRVVKML